MAALKWVLGLTIASLGSAALIASQTAPPVGRAIVAGMAGPLLIVSVTWLQAARIHRAAPGRLTSFMMTTFVVKMVLFGAYVVVAVRVLALPTVPFVVSFASYFVVLYAAEAFWLSRLSRPDAPAART